VAANKQIIVSAGVYESPKRLLLSGIGSTDHLSSVGVCVESYLPQLLIFLIILISIVIMAYFNCSSN